MQLYTRSAHRLTMNIRAVVLITLYGIVCVSSLEHSETCSSPGESCAEHTGSSSTPPETMAHTAKWNGVVIAETNDVQVVEGNKYFPTSSIKQEYFSKTDKTTGCPWKGTAHYYDITVNGKKNPGAAWYYPDPKPAADMIKDRVAFWKGVVVS